jgi:hypothetical protein
VFNAVYTSNASAPIMVGAKQFSVSGSRNLSEAAGFAIGHIGHDQIGTPQGLALPASRQHALK